MAFSALSTSSALMWLGTGALGPISMAFDLVIIALLVGLAARILHTRQLFEAIVLFIAYGLTLSLAWIRLGATDLALAEAALGAGVTGALLLNTFQRLAERTPGEADPAAREGEA
jgi:energy-converting hydrogenase B subunit D